MYLHGDQATIKHLAICPAKLAWMLANHGKRMEGKGLVTEEYAKMRVLDHLNPLLSAWFKILVNMTRSRYRLILHQ